MESIVEFALYTWVAVSILAVLVQLVRIIRYRRANAAKSAALEATAPEAATTVRATPAAIDLDRRAPASADPVPTPVSSSRVSTENTPAGQPIETVSATAPGAGTSAAPPADPPVIDIPVAEVPSPEVPIDDIPDDPTPPSMPMGSTPAATVASDSAAAEEPPASIPQPTPALADVLAGVRLPWNLLPTVDHSHQPSNDRVALLTNEGEPPEVGADVADELERLGFSIAPRGEDTAIATRGEHVLGLQIIPDAMNAKVGSEPRFPGATPSSIALDIWIES